MECRIIPVIKKLNKGAIMKKKLIAFLFTVAICSTHAESTMMDMSNMSNMMYMDFGMGVGSADHWSGSSMAINAMTMGYYVKPNLGVEIGMDMLPNGTYDDNGAMINSFHVAAKGIFSYTDIINFYGKLGLGVNAGQGNTTTNSTMGSMEMSDMQMITPVDVGPYYAAGMQFNLSKKFAIYLEDSGVIAVSSTTSDDNFGSTNMVTAGVEIRM